jgi:hypothetical protein
MRVGRSRFATNRRRVFRSTMALVTVCSCMSLCQYAARGQQPQEARPQAGQGPTDTQTGQQQKPTFGLPARAPGYELYYSREDGNVAFATRWGYFDGWRDGKHDSELGISKPPVDQDRYKLVPDHGLHPGIPRTEYKTAYRTAYLHGYDHACKTVNGVDAKVP